MDYFEGIQACGNSQTRILSEAFGMYGRLAKTGTMKK